MEHKGEFDSVTGENIEREISHKLDLISLMEVCTLPGLTLDRAEILNNLAHMTPFIVEAEDAVIFLLSESRKELLHSFGSSGVAPHLHKQRCEAGEGVQWWVIHEGEPVIMNEPGSDSRFRGNRDGFAGISVRNLVCVPIKREEEISGALCAINKKNNCSFGQLDLKLCEAIASQAGMAIHRADLMEENVKSARLAAVGETVGGLAHCVKNILNVLKGGEYIVQQGLKKEDLSIVKNGWHIMEHGVGRISNLVMDMLSFLKERAPNYSRVKPHALVTEAIEMLRDFGEDRKVTLHCIDDEKLKEVSIDNLGIFRCLVNLIKNGIDACAENGGSVIIELNEEPDDYFSIKISDTGCGMDEDTVKKLFTRFFSTKGSHGTGLGLIVVDKIVKEHGGHIEVTSMPGEGTTFCLKLPVANPAQ